MDISKKILLHLQVHFRFCFMHSFFLCDQWMHLLSFHVLLIWVIWLMNLLYYLNCLIASYLHPVHPVQRPLTCLVLLNSVSIQRFCIFRMLFLLTNCLYVVFRPIINYLCCHNALWWPNPGCPVEKWIDPCRRPTQLQRPSQSRP